MFAVTAGAAMSGSNAGGYNSKPVRSAIGPYGAVCDDRHSDPWVVVLVTVLIGRTCVQLGHGTVLLSLSHPCQGALWVLSCATEFLRRSVVQLQGTALSCGAQRTEPCDHASCEGGLQDEDRQIGQPTVVDGARGRPARRPDDVMPGGPGA
jgi:hypothetical protein